MPATPASEMAPSVSLSFANNFWGKEDAGVDPLLERMHNAKITSDELKSFYTQRAAIEEEYSRKILNLARKPLGSSEAGTLRMSMDVLRGELEAMGKSHQHIAQQMKGELEEPLSTFSGGIKERRKIIQNGIEKLLKTKTQQTHTVNKARDRYEQDCLKIKGYLAQGHMVMGQEERKNKAKLEKTQIQMSATSSEYEQAVKVLEETTARWNREWKAACDKFQDLEEERLDFTKSSLWSFANISSTVCVSDDASCEKIRLSLEDCDVEKDIAAFIKDSGTGQEIPDPPKYINFCRGDINDNASDVSDDANYSVAQFQRTMNPAFRSSSPQPSTYSSHHDPASTLAQEMTLGSSVNSERSQVSQRSHRSGSAAQPLPRRSSQQTVPTNAYQEFPKVPHNEYPMDGMTQFCRLGPPSDRSSIPSPTRPEDDSHSEISNANSFSSIEPPTSPMKQLNGSTVSTNSQQDDKTLQKRRSGFFQNHSPFGRRKSKHENVAPASISSGPAQRNTWAPAARPQTATSPVRPPFGREATKNVGFGNDPMPSPDPEPVDPRANFQLNIGNNVFDVATPDARKRSVAAEEPSGELDPIAQALAELKGVRKQASTRVSADRYAGIPTPVPGAGRASPSPLIANSDARAGQRGTPPPSYDQPMRRLGAPQPAFTSKQMQQTTASYMTQKRDMFNAPPRNTPSQMGSRPASRGGDSRGSGEMMRSASPAPLRTSSPAPPRAISPRPSTGYDRRSQPMPQGQGYRSTSPNPYGGAPPGSMSAGRPRAQSSSPMKQQGPGYNAAYASHGNSPVSSMPRSASPNPQFRGSAGQGSRPTSSRGDPAAMAMQLAPAGDQGYPPSSRGAPGGPLRPTSTYYGAEGGWAAASSPRGGAPQQQQQQAPPQQQQQLSTRARSQSSAGQRQFTKDGRPILQFSRAMYMYQAAIPEELTFAKGDILAVLRLQDDGWWEAEVAGKDGRRGLVPSNYLVAA